MTRKDGKVYGRGSVDMKEFVASMLSAAGKVLGQKLRTPPHLPLVCIVGEPTGLAVTTCHKGKLAARVRFMGRVGYSALAPFLVNALYLANEFITALRDVQVHLQASGVQDADYDVSYTTLHVRRISSGRRLGRWHIHNCCVQLLCILFV